MKNNQCINCGRRSKEKFEPFCSDSCKAKYGEHVDLFYKLGQDNIKDIIKERLGWYEK